MAFEFPRIIAARKMSVEVPSLAPKMKGIAFFKLIKRATGHLSKSHLTLYDNKQKSLDENKIELSNKDIGKIRIISHLRRCCKDKGFKIDFSPNKGIRTLDPQIPINFWVFEHRMQRNKDKKLNDWF